MCKIKTDTPPPPQIIVLSVCVFAREKVMTKERGDELSLLNTLESLDDDHSTKPLARRFRCKALYIVVV